MGNQKSPQEPPRCAGGCGFFGNPAFDNYCSKCFKTQTQSQDKPIQSKNEEKKLKNVEKQIIEIKPENKKELKPTNKEEESKAAVTPTEEEKKEEELTKQPVQEDTTHCWTCQKRVGLLGIKCKCGYVFCSKHRYAEQHQCSFDYKSAQKTDLETLNPAIVANKIEKL